MHLTFTSDGHDGPKHLLIKILYSSGIWQNVLEMPEQVKKLFVPIGQDEPRAKRSVIPVEASFLKLRYVQPTNGTRP